jgi:hypothetical protein
MSKHQQQVQPQVQPQVASPKVVALPVTQAQLQAIMDGAFAYLESVTQRPMLEIVEKIANTTLDAELPALLTYLAGKGIITVAP